MLQRTRRTTISHGAKLSLRQLLSCTNPTFVTTDTKSHISPMALKMAIGVPLRPAIVMIGKKSANRKYPEFPPTRNRQSPKARQRDRHPSALHPKQLFATGCSAGRCLALVVCQSDQRSFWKRVRFDCVRRACSEPQGDALDIATHQPLWLIRYEQTMAQVDRVHASSPVPDLTNDNRVPPKHLPLIEVPRRPVRTAHVNQ